MEFEGELKLVIEEILDVLREADEDEWRLYFEQISSEINYNVDKHLLIQKLLSAYRGGMGSFSDLVLSEEGNMRVDENIKLRNLKNKLYTIITQ